MDALSVFKCSAGISNLKCNRNKLRYLTPALIQKMQSMGYTHQLNVQMRICESCRALVQHNRYTSKKPRSDLCDPQPSTSGYEPPTSDEQPSTSGHQPDDTPEVPSIPSLESITSADQLQGPYNVEIFNSIVHTLNVSPISLRNMRTMDYRVTKSANITQAVRQKIFNMDPTDISKAEAFDEMVTQLKNKFNSSPDDRNEQIKVLSVLPQSWSINKIVEEFNAPVYMVRQMKNLVKEQGILCTTSARSRHGISELDKKTVIDFFDSNDISRPMPGINDYVSELRNGLKERVQKRLLMMSLKEAYTIFEETYASIKIGFTLFTTLRPKHCKLLDSKGTHNVCVCTIHENVKLMLNSLGIVSQEEIMDKLLCNFSNRTTECYFRACKKCATNEEVADELAALLEESGKEDVIFQQWLTTDRCNLENIMKPADEFATYFVDKIDKLITHDFICKEQSLFLRNKKDSLKEDELIVICDFSENYSFIIQNAAQGYHWNNAQATIHPFVVYYMKDSKIENVSFIIISEVLAHDTIAVQLFISKLIEFLKLSIDFSKITFMSDGAAAHYKNRKNFASLCNFKSMHKLEADWHFFATSHGKGPCDAIGGTLKRMAKRASLAQEYGNTITTPRELYDWAVKQTEKSITKMNFCYISTEQYEKMSEELEDLFHHAKTISGTQKFHSFQPIAANQIAAKKYSNSTEHPKKFTLFDNVRK